MRRTPALLSALAVAAVVVTSLVGCSSSASAACTPVFSDGDSSKVVKATSSTASFPTPLVVKSSQVSQLKAGKGSPVQSGDQVDYTYSLYDGATGKQIATSSSSNTATARSGALDTAKATAVQKSLRCATTGERYALVTTVKEGFGAGAGGSSYPDDATLVVVVDVVDHFLGKANGINVLPQDGMPAVITAVDGQPGIVIQEIGKPKDLRISTIKAGAGATVEKGATVHVKYSGWSWPTTSSDKPVIWPGSSSGGDGQASWTNDQAVDLTVDSKSLPVGLYKALVGAKVGSQVLVVMPPKAGFGAGSSSLGVDANATLIMVVDVLGIK